jgi:hypothetical protein
VPNKKSFLQFCKHGVRTPCRNDSYSWAVTKGLQSVWTTSQKSPFWSQTSQKWMKSRRNACLVTFVSHPFVLSPCHVQCGLRANCLGRQAKAEGLQNEHIPKRHRSRMCRPMTGVLNCPAAGPASTGDKTGSGYSYVSGVREWGFERITAAAANSTAAGSGQRQR